MKDLLNDTLQTVFIDYVCIPCILKVESKHVGGYKIILDIFFSSTKKTTSPKKGIKKPKKFKPPANFGFQVTISTMKKSYIEL